MDCRCNVGARPVHKLCETFEIHSRGSQFSLVLMANHRRALLPFLVLFASFAFVGVRLFFLQVWNHEELNRAVQKLIYRERPEQPCRGMICDRQGRVLAMSVKSYTLFFDCAQIGDMAATVNALRNIGVAVPREVFASGNRSSYVPVLRNVDLATMQKIKALKIKGIGFTPGFERQYPQGKMACHLLGVVGKDGNGLEGIELLNNASLSGEKIKARRYRDGRGREIADKLVDSSDLLGANISLTIDGNLQFIAEQEIEKAWKESHAKRVVAVIEDPQTGEILAMAARPAFDPANFAGSNLKNPIISDVFEPGSTFKLVTAAAALEEKAVKASEVIWCEDGKYMVFGHAISDHEKKGFLTLKQIIEYSSNIGCAKIGQRLGKETLYRYIRQFGFYSPTGIGLPGETKGLLKKPENWSGLSLPIISFGQEIGTTALQIVNAYAAVANDGLLMEPQIVKEIRTAEGETIFQAQKRTIRRACTPETARQLKEMFRGVVEEGTGQAAKVPGYSVGGKTGTAQKRDPRTGRYSATCYVASFCGIIPLSQPRLVIYVALDEPQGDYWGSSRAGPVFNRIASRAMHHLKIDPDLEPVRLAGIKKVVSNRSN